MEPDIQCDLEDFAEFIDVDYQEPADIDESLPAFGRNQLIISRSDIASARADVKRLEVDTETQKRIIAGSLLTAKDADKTRSGRDMSILYYLIAADYDYPAIKSIFFNPFLKCSNRITGKVEAALEWDVRQALNFVHESHRPANCQTTSLVQSAKGELITIYVDNIKPEKTTWLWPERIPLGK